MKLSILASIVVLFLADMPGNAQTQLSPQLQSPFGHPIIPDLIADPSLVEIDGTFYCYATTDGAGAGLATAGAPV